MESMDFKYLIQDFSWYYIGARLTYNELTETEDVPGRLRSAIFRYIEDEVSLDMRIAEHLLTMDRKSRSAMVYEQLQTEVTILPAPQRGREKQQVIKAPRLFDDETLRRSLEWEEISEIRFKKKNLIFLRV